MLQLTFVFLVLPCLLLGYLGQAAFLMENLDKSQQIFFLSIPSKQNSLSDLLCIATYAETKILIYNETELRLLASRLILIDIFQYMLQVRHFGQWYS